MCAMFQRRSVATTMGFSALDGLMMGSRCGALDPGVILYMLDALKMSSRDIGHLLYNESGLLGVSGVSDDMRDLLASRDPHAAEAVDLFVYRIVRELGSLAAALGGLDALVFTAGIGEHSAEIRRPRLRPGGLARSRARRGGQLQGRSRHRKARRPRGDSGVADRRGKRHRQGLPGDALTAAPNCDEIVA